MSRAPAPDHLTLHSVVDAARRRGVVFATSRDETGTLSIRWRPPRALDRDEVDAIRRAGALALAALIGDPDG